MEDVPLLPEKAILHDRRSILSLKLKDAVSGQPVNVTQFLRGEDWTDDFNPYVDLQRRKALLDLIAKGVLVIDDSDVMETAGNEDQAMEVEMQSMTAVGIYEMERRSAIEGQSEVRQRRGAVVMS